MREKEIGLFWQGWFLEEQRNGSAAPEDYLIRTYLEWHAQDAGSEQEKRERIEGRIRAWKEAAEGFLRMLGRYPEEEGLQEWQAARMLENVIQELELDREETCRYLANVKKLLYNNLLFAVGEPSASELGPVFEEIYEEDWRSAAHADESTLSLRFSETVSLMRYAGLSYEEDCQRILAETAMGREQRFPAGERGQASRDIRLFTDFLVSEMLLMESGELSAEERTALAEHAVPVYTAAVSCIDRGEKPGHILRQAQIYISSLLTAKGFSIAACLAAVLLAVKIVWELLTLAAAGAAVSVGLLSLWKACRNAGKRRNKEENEALEWLGREVQRLRSQRPFGKRKNGVARAAVKKDRDVRQSARLQLYSESAQRGEEHPAAKETIPEVDRYV